MIAFRAHKHRLATPSFLEATYGRCPQGMKISLEKQIHIRILPAIVVLSMTESCPRRLRHP